MYHSSGAPWEGGGGAGSDERLFREGVEVPGAEYAGG